MGAKADGGDAFVLSNTVSEATLEIAAADLDHRRDPPRQTVRSCLRSLECRPCDPLTGTTVERCGPAENRLWGTQNGRQIGPPWAITQRYYSPSSLTVDLDDLALLKRQDPGAMGDRIAELPNSIVKAWQAAQQFELPDGFRSASAVLITGMGGSAIGGDLVRSLAEAECPVPVIVQRGYDLPAFAGGQTLVIAVSHSGGTEETLSQVREALRRGCKILAITSGGALAETKGPCIFRFEYPSQPRAALGYLFIPLVSFFGQLGWLRDRSAEIEEAAAVLRELQPALAPESPAARNEAKQLAQAMAGRVPFVYGGGIMTEVAHRWKTQLNENSKAWAAYDTFPELNHNAVVGYERPTSILDHALVVLLETSHEHPRIGVRERVTRELLEMRGVSYKRVPARGQGALAQMLAAILTGDYASYYLAHLYEVDPTPVAAIDHLKQELAKAAA